MPSWGPHENKRHSLIIVAVLFASYAYFYQGNGNNQNSRFDLTRAIVEQHTLRIDSYHSNTHDKAFKDGHFYSEKAPGMALAAVPVWQISNIGLHLAKKDGSQGRTVVAERYLVTIATVALPAALGAACLFLLALRLGASVDGAGFAAVAWGLATPFWCYSTLFWGHAPAAVALVFAFAGAMALIKFTSSRRDLLLGTVIGLTAGWSVVIEFPSAPSAAVLALFALALVWPDRRRMWHVTLGIAAGAIPCVLVLMIYNLTAFGSLFQIGYPYNVLAAQYPWQRQGFMGLTYPKLGVLREILLGQFRGLLPLAPVVAVAPFGFWLLWKRPSARMATIVLTIIATYYVLFQASYSVWDGGWTYGPRFLSPALPFLCLPLALLWTRSTTALRALLAVLALYGVAMSLMAISTFPMPPDYVKAPLREMIWPSFHAGHLAAVPGTWNLGMLMGLPGLVSLVPLLLIWAAALGAWIWAGRSSRLPRNAEKAV